MEIARENASLNHIDVEFIQEDIFKWEKLPKQFDIIVSNPPYVSENSKDDDQGKNLDREPPRLPYMSKEKIQ
ncbi:Eco57I restriction-modification methylase domain-containing protein [Antarcticibacterium sp. 1MA-6-2]|uniref:Eco57I restriction-modification methylase domain-containing protein n=1 Tax=Antarcticibacterium sp. 1MA-6-2 TaxID=2908210 RepID=UPI0038FC4639